MNYPDPFRFCNLKGRREEWRPSLDLNHAELWERVGGACAVYIPASYWRRLIKKGNLISLASDMVMMASGEWPVGINNGIHIYSDAFNGKPSRFDQPIIIVHKAPSIAHVSS